MNRRSTGARTGWKLAFTMLIVAALGPCFAGARPLVVVSSAGFDMPAIRDAVSLLPRAGPENPAESGVPPAARQWKIYPPVGHDPLAIDLNARLAPPGPGHWLGTDELGRDILSRLIHAARPSLMVAAIATLLSLSLGIPIGAAAGYGGPTADLFLSRLIDASLSFPALILLLVISAISIQTTGGASGGHGSHGTDGALVSLVVVGGAIGLARWGVIARYMRAEVLRLGRTDMEAAARAAGAAPLRVLALHLIPAGLAPVVVSAAFGAGTAVVAEASVSFLGMGVQPPSPTWGQMLASAWQHGAGSWWLLLFPGAMLGLTVGAFNRIGESLRRRAGEQG